MPTNCNLEKLQYNTMNDDAVAKILQNLRRDVIGGGDCMEGPWGNSVPLVYADYTASGRLLQSVENFMQKVVYPVYANTHTDASYFGVQTNALYQQARQTICHCCRVDPTEFAVIFTGSGATGAINKLTQILKLHKKQKFFDRPVVFVGPYEHHSNEVIWREKKCDVIVIPEDQQGSPDLNILQKKLTKYKQRTLKIGSFSAGSNITGIVTDVGKITQVLHENGALAFFDYAASGAYVPINASNQDAIFLSPHKFIGGPGSSGVLVLRRSIYKSKVPSIPGGGTVSYVTPQKHWFVHDIEAREDGGTPPILQGIRAALALSLKNRVGEDIISQLEYQKINKFLQTFSLSDSLNIFLIGSDRPIYWKFPRLSIFSFLIPYHDPLHPHQKTLHQNFVATLLNDVYGIQSRSGCFCAGPYGHRLFDSIFGNVHAISKKIQPLVVEGGFQALKWGWVRINLNYFISDEEVDYIIQAIIQISKFGWKLLPQYSVDIQTGLWKHNSFKNSNYASKKSQKNLLSFYDYEFGEDLLKARNVAPNQMNFAASLQHVKKIYDNSLSIQNVHYDSKFDDINVQQVRWFPLPHEAFYMLKKSSFSLEDQSLIFSQNFRQQYLKKGTYNQQEMSPLL